MNVHHFTSFSNEELAHYFSTSSDPLIQLFVERLNNDEQVENLQEELSGLEVKVNELEDQVVELKQDKRILKNDLEMLKEENQALSELPINSHKLNHVKQLMNLAVEQLGQLDAA